MTAEALPGCRRRRRNGGGGRQEAGSGSDLAAGPAAGVRRPDQAVPGQPAGYAPFVGPVCSPDGKAAIVTSYIKGNGEGERILDPVKAWRDRSPTPAAASR